jgi:hypothetical protein
MDCPSDPRCPCLHQLKVPDIVVSVEIKWPSPSEPQSQKQPDDDKSQQLSDPTMEYYIPSAFVDDTIAQMDNLNIQSEEPVRERDEANCCEVLEFETIYESPDVIQEPDFESPNEVADETIETEVEIIEYYDDSEPEL